VIAEGGQRDGGLAVVRGCLIERDPTRELSTDGSQRSHAAGIVATHNGAWIEDCVVRGWSAASIVGPDRQDSGIVPSAGVNPGLTLTIRDSWFDGCYAGVEITGTAAFVQLRNNLWTGAPAHNVRKPVAWNLWGASPAWPLTVLTAHNVVVWEPQRATHPATGGVDAYYSLIASNSDGRTHWDADCGVNYVWCNGNTTSYGAPAGSFGWTFSATDAYFRDAPAARPNVQPDGTLPPGDPAESYGAWGQPSPMPSEDVMHVAEGTILPGLTVGFQAAGAPAPSRAEVDVTVGTLTLCLDGQTHSFSLADSDFDTLAELAAAVIGAGGGWMASLPHAGMDALPSARLHDQPPRSVLSAPADLSWGSETEFVLDVAGGVIDPAQHSLLIESGPFAGQFRPIRSYDALSGRVVVQPYMACPVLRIWFERGGTGSSTAGPRLTASVAVTSTGVTLTESGGGGPGYFAFDFAQYPTLLDLFGAINALNDWTAELIAPGLAELASSRLAARPSDVYWGWTCARPFLAMHKPQAAAPVAVVPHRLPRTGNLNELPPHSLDDCNTNGTLDRIDLGAGGRPDADADGVPDECELICAGAAGDLDGNGGVDADDIRPFMECVFAVALVPEGCGCADMGGDAVLDAADVGLFVAALLSPSPRAAAGR
jgi:hypothetical protein